MFQELTTSSQATLKTPALDFIFIRSGWGCNLCLAFSSLRLIFCGSVVRKFPPSSESHKTTPDFPGEVSQTVYFIYFREGQMRSAVGSDPRSIILIPCGSCPVWCHILPPCITPDRAYELTSRGRVVYNIVRPLYYYNYNNNNSNNLQRAHILQ